RNAHHRTAARDQAGDQVHRLRAGRRAARQGVASRPAVVRRERAAGDPGHRGGGVASGLSFSWSLVAIFLGAVIGTLFMAFHSAQGPKLGLPQMIQSRPQFGYYGALLLFIGFNVFNTQIAEQMVVETLNVNKVVGAIIITALAFAFALLGYRLIHKFCQWASVLFIVVFVL